MKDTYLCVECGEPNKALFRIFSKSALTLQTCVRCHCIIDKYIEYDFITAVFIDILLLKVSAYRHLLFNSSKKTYLPRLVVLTLISCSYVEWVHEKQKLEPNFEEGDDGSNPVFYELEWGYYAIMLQQSAKAFVFAITFVLFGFLASKSFHSNGQNKQISYRHIVEGVALSYCWNLVMIPSLVWNHYSMYHLLSQIALLISCKHIFHVCVLPNHVFSAITIICSYAMMWSVGKWLQDGHIN